MNTMALEVERNLEEHDQYFSRVISWIPPDLYEAHEEEDEIVNDRYYKHKKQALPPAERKLMRKKRIKETYAVVDEVQGKTGIKGVLSSPGSRGEDAADGGGAIPMNGDMSSLDILRQRLKQRIIGLQENRKKKVKTSHDANGGSSGETSPVKKKKKSKIVDERRNSVATSRSDAMKEMSDSHKHKRDKRKIMDNFGNDSDAGGEAVELIGGSSSGGDGGDCDVPMDVAFNDIRGAAGDSSNNRDGRKASKSGKPGSKTIRLKRMIDEAEKKRKRLEDLKQQGDYGKKRAQEEQWGEMMREAAGEKVGVDVAKIKKALKRREKAKEKSAVKWKEREDAVTSAKAARVEKRENNLEQRQGRKANFLDEGSISTNSAAGTGGKKHGEKKVATSPRGGFEGKKRHLLNGS